MAARLTRLVAGSGLPLCVESRYGRPSFAIIQQWFGLGETLEVVWVLMWRRLNGAFIL